MKTYYREGQLSAIYSFIRKKPKWFLLGGPADANEAQAAVIKWPNLNVVGVDPNPQVIRFQTENGWPKNAPLVQAYLYDRVCDLPVAGTEEGIRNARVYGPDPGGVD